MDEGKTLEQILQLNTIAGFAERSANTDNFVNVACDSIGKRNSSSQKQVGAKFNPYS